MVAAPLRSLLFVPADSERKIEKSQGSAADAIVYDLEDSVAAARKDIGREMIAAHLRSRTEGRTKHWVRINPVSTPEALVDLAAVVGGRPDGILLPKAESPEDVRIVSYYLDALETREGLPLGSIPIIPVTTETARSPLALHLYPDSNLPRLRALTWGAEDLSASIGASANTDLDGTLSLTYRVTRSLVLMAAKGTGVDVIDTVYPNFRDLDGLRTTCLASQREGFTGCFAIHPDQVAVINEAYSPTDADIAFAELVVAAFAASPDVGVVGVEGKMLDKPHLVQAQKVLALRDAFLAR